MNVRVVTFTTYIQYKDIRRRDKNKIEMSQLNIKRKKKRVIAEQVNRALIKGGERTHFTHTFVRKKKKEKYYLYKIGQRVKQRLSRHTMLHTKKKKKKCINKSQQDYAEKR